MIECEIICGAIMKNNDLSEHVLTHFVACAVCLPFVTSKCTYYCLWMYIHMTYNMAYNAIFFCQRSQRPEDGRKLQTNGDVVTFLRHHMAPDIFKMINVIALVWARDTRALWNCARRAWNSVMPGGGGCRMFFWVRAPLPLAQITHAMRAQCEWINVGIVTQSMCV